MSEQDEARRSSPAGGGGGLVARTFLFSDVVASSEVRTRLRARWGDQGEKKYLEDVLGPHNRRLAECFSKFGGTIFHRAGDAYGVAFPYARPAILCSVECQRSLMSLPIPIEVAGGVVPPHVQVRIGLHRGDATHVVEPGREDYNGGAVDAAHRVLERAHGERVLTSDVTWREAGELEDVRIRAHDWGSYDLKGVGPLRLVEVLWDQRKPREPRDGSSDARGESPGKRRDLDGLRRDYLQALAARHEWLDFTGIPQVRNVVRLRLDDVFVPLASTREVAEGDPRRHPEMVRRGKTGAPRGVAGLAEVEAAGRRVSIAQALKEPLLVILGDPGSGKTTILKHVALRLAAGSSADLGLGDAGQAPLPMLLPVADYAASLRERDVALGDYLGVYHERRGQPGLGPLFQDALERQRAIVLLDGLDEVLDPGQRLRVARAVQDFVSRFRREPVRRAEGAPGNRFVVTSRIAGYEAARLAGFAHVTVLPFDPEDVGRFCGQWCLAWERVVDTSTAAEARATDRARALVEAIRANDKVGRLAANPLLLTIIALIHYQNVRLPEQRVELYRLVVEALAETWNRARTLGSQAVDARLENRPLTARLVVNTLGPVARWLHEREPGGLVDRRALESKMAEVLREHEGVSDARGLELAEGFLDLVTRASGLLQERGPGQFAFLHLTFEEYLAARAIADLDRNRAAFVRARWSDPAWREVILLAIGASHPDQAAELVETVLDAPAKGAARGKNVVLAGEALADVGREGVTGAVWRTTVDALVRLVEEPDRAKLVPVATRVEAGDVLGLVGDPRITDGAWVEVPAGEFLMGTTPKDVERLARRYRKEWADWAEDELPQHRVRVGAFRIGKHPVTNQELRRFVEADGYGTREYWSAAGWRWRQRTPEEEEKLREWQQRKGRSEPAYWQHPDLGIRRPNRPAVGVTWYEAEAYCAWLTRHLRGEGKIGEREIVRLPSEAEWEKAARGTDGRWWPWGNEWGGGRANAEGKPGHTTPVGIYPDGASPYGALDMAGNVWEWTRSVDGPYPYKPDDGREDPNAEGPRRLRGGAWDFTAVGARSASRLVGTPVFAYSSVGFRCVVVPHASPR